MWRKIAAAAMAVAGSASATGACAMTAPAHAQGSCRVTAGEEKLPAEAGGAAAICAAVHRAVAEQAPNVRYSAEIRVLSRSALAATLETSGRKLPELKFSVSDRELNPRSIGHFADSVAAALARPTER